MLVKLKFQTTVENITCAPMYSKEYFSLDYSQFWISMHLSVFIISTACIFSEYSSCVQGVGCVSNQKEDGSRQ